ncbi:MAG: hypothetical protein PVI15_07575 [Chromatiales bacterium]|jgi:hypothetical protein
MFKDYKEVFKDLRDIQDQLWRNSIASFPGAEFLLEMNEWQRKTLENVSGLIEQSVTQSLDLQREWLGQWAERAGSKDLKPKAFKELNEEARRSTQRWLDNQNQLWDQWLKVIRDSGKPGTLPDFTAWEKAVQESVDAQLALLDDWSKMTDFKKLSGKEVTKLSDQIVKAMEESIDTQRRLWSHWFDALGEPGKSEGTAPKSPPKAKKPKAAAKPPAGSGS